MSIITNLLLKGRLMKTVQIVILFLVLIVITQPLLGQSFPTISETQRIDMLKHPGKKPVRMVFDTDTYNEIDDQFALVYALISPELDVKAVYAAPFKNNRSRTERRHGKEL